MLRHAVPDHGAGVKIPRLTAEPPLGVAALRIALGAVILISPELWQAPYWAGLPAHLRFAPEGLGWALQVVPIDPQSARVAQVLLIASCAAAIFGFGARLAMLGVTVFGLYVLGLSQLSGAVIHNMHLLWFSALLAVSPCRDALSLQSWLLGRLRGRPYAAMPAALVYAVALQCPRVLLAGVYFFPGFWKLKTSGLDWIFSDNLRNQIYWKWVPTRRRSAEPSRGPTAPAAAARGAGGGGVRAEFRRVDLESTRPTAGRGLWRVVPCRYAVGHGHHVHQPDRVLPPRRTQCMSGQLSRRCGETTTGARRSRERGRQPARWTTSRCRFV
jgi:hypothetical protein